VFERLPLRVQTGKRRQQAWVNVEDAPRESVDKARRQQTHISSETDQINASLAKGFDYFTLVFLALATFTLNRECLNPTLARECKTRSVSLVTNHHDNLSVWDLSRANRIVKREHV
jgi:hypothetical protein